MRRAYRGGLRIKRDSVMTDPTMATQVSGADERARAVEEQMTDEERFSLIISVIGATRLTARDRRIPEGVAMSAGYTPGVPRLGVPALQSSDASMGITNPGYRPDDPGATALPASIVVGASFNPRLAREGGRVLGREARIRGFNAVLAAGSTWPATRATGATSSTTPKIPTTARCWVPRRSTASRVRASSRR
jgi:beta-glucosidase